MVKRGGKAGARAVNKVLGTRRGLIGNAAWAKDRAPKMSNLEDVQFGPSGMMALARAGAIAGWGSIEPRLIAKTTTTSHSV
ncbi:MAG: hypothetical protein B7Z75_09750 [Acidocella sp. 20-57-95]|nr:MAG: hypothetical protein B7Z75_09750 [Acidocella sp. 20-57-95]OYV60921.1 MAG: hypothetical protein B7Z71_05420 [Acidocella sp. 21-58-7]